MGRSRGSVGTGGFLGTCDLRANFCCWLHTSGTISPTHACLPVASFLVLSARRGQGRSVEGCRNMVPARRVCDLPGSQGAPGALPCLCSSFSFFSTFRYFFASASSLLCMQHSPSFPPTVPSFPSTNTCSLGSFFSLPSFPHQHCLPKHSFFFRSLAPSPCFPQALLIHSPSLPFPPAAQAPVRSLSVSLSLTVWGKSVCVNAQIPLFIG